MAVRLLTRAASVTTAGSRRCVTRACPLLAAAAAAPPGLRTRPALAAAVRTQATMVDTSKQVTALRALFTEHGIHSYIVPSEDSHQSEYLAACDERRSFISGFDGSSGCAMVTEDQAALFTDGRYFLQAGEQLDGNWTLVKDGLPTSPSKDEWLIKALKPESVVGVDPTLISVVEFRTLHKALQKASIQLTAVPGNLVDQVWADLGRPPAPSAPVFPLADKYSGQSARDKLAYVRKSLEAKQRSALVLTSLDDIAWLFNLRGGDIIFNPVFFSYALVTPSEATLYIAPSKVMDDISKHLAAAGVATAPYQSFIGDLEAKAPALTAKGPVWVGPKCSHAVASVIPDAKISTDITCVTHAKSVKNPTELEGMRRCHIRDAVAMCEFFVWLENTVAEHEASNESPELPLTEVDLADRLEQFRSEQADFVTLSFATISSVGPNGAVIHYHPRPGTCAKFRTDTLYLLDSGGQYMDGTTDVTRTSMLGKHEPSDHMRTCFTRVLQGHIDLDRAVFPNGTSGILLDSFARRPLWSEGLDYHHGTGHGVGSFLNVHEGPIGISSRKRAADCPLKESMVVTNEPGYYEDGSFGIRIENTVEVVATTLKHNFKGVGYLGLKPVTLVPIQARLIKTELLTPEQIAWVDAYHRRCLAEVGPELKAQGKAAAHAWLCANTQPLPHT